MLYNRKSVKQYVKDKAGVSISSDFWVGLDVSIRKLLDTAIHRKGSFRRLTSSELGFNSKLLRGNTDVQE